jgi:hypothetical protein
VLLPQTPAESTGQHGRAETDDHEVHRWFYARRGGVVGSHRGEGEGRSSRVRTPRGGRSLQYQTMEGTFSFRESGRGCSRDRRELNRLRAVWQPLRDGCGRVAAALSGRRPDLLGS